VPAYAAGKGLNTFWTDFLNKFFLDNLEVFFYNDHYLNTPYCLDNFRFNSLNSWLTMTDPTGNSAQFEISELRRLLAEEQTQSVARK
jgi:hypothetical protein